jgi:5-methylcytosine-specific restriction endonuclease McrA
MNIVTRKNAKSLGLSRYFTGVPCKHGHVAERTVNGGRGCLECARLWRVNNPDKTKANSYKWRQTFPAKFKAIDEAWRKRHPDRSLAKSLRWKKNNPEKNAVNSRNYTGRKRGIGTHTLAEVTTLLEQQRHKCANPFCRADLRMIKKHLDHIIPLSRTELFPSNELPNLQWLCQSCNDSKHTKTMDEFIRGLS